MAVIAQSWVSVVANSLAKEESYMAIQNPPDIPATETVPLSERALDGRRRVNPRECLARENSGARGGVADCVRLESAADRHRQGVGWAFAQRTKPSSMCDGVILQER
jgi:hypothetical protein